MKLPRPDFFISATTKDLKTMRTVIEKAVLDIGAYPVVQEHFAPAGSTVAGMIRKRIESCDAVIHLVGRCYGMEDETASAACDGRSYADGRRSYADGRRSYTQLEHDVARELGKPLYLFICADDFSYAGHEPEPEEKQQLQAAHRARTLDRSHLYEIVRDEDELRGLIKLLEERVQLLGRQLRRSRRWLWAAAVLLLVAVLGVLLGMALLKGDSTKRIVIGRQQADELARLRQQFQDSEQRNAEVIQIVREIRDKSAPASLPAGTGVADAREEVRQERGLSHEELSQKLAAAETSAAERVRLATEIEARAQGEIDTARKRRRAALKELGDAALANFKYPEAATHYREAVTLYDRQKESSEWIQAQTDLGYALYYGGGYGEATQLWQEILPELERILGKEHPDTLTNVNNLAAVLQAKGDYAGAEPLFRRALEASERVLGKEHPDTLTNVNNLAALFQAKGDYAAAEPLCRRALEANEHVLGKEHPSTLISVNNLAALLKAKGDYVAAEPLCWRALEARERVLGREHPDTLISVSDLAALLQAKGDYAAAEPLCRRALEGNERVLGKEHPSTLICVNNLAAVLQANGDYAAAEALCRRAIEANERVLGKEHPSTLTSVNNLAAMLQNKRDYAAAEPVCRRALESRERVLGKDHPDTSLSAYDLAMLLKNLGRDAEAKPLAWQAYQGFRKSKGDEHGDTRNARELLIALGEKVEQ